MGTKSNTLIENLRTNCQSFFVCDNNKAIEQFCQNGMLFNAESQSCDWPQNVNCGFHWGHRRRRDVGANLPVSVECQKKSRLPSSSFNINSFCRTVKKRSRINSTVTPRTAVRHFSSASKRNHLFTHVLQDWPSILTRTNAIIQESVNAQDPKSMKWKRLGKLFDFLKNFLGANFLESF